MRIRTHVMRECNCTPMDGHLSLQLDVMAAAGGENPVYADSLKSSLPISILRISDVPAPIS